MKQLANQNANEMQSLQTDFRRLLSKADQIQEPELKHSYLNHVKLQADIVAEMNKRDLIS